MRRERQPMEYPDKVTVYHKLGRIKEDSFALDAISSYSPPRWRAVVGGTDYVQVLSEKHQRVAARCFEDIVVYNYKPSDPAVKPGKAPIPEWMRSVFAETLREQKEAAEDATNEIRDIAERIASVEARVLARKEM